MLNSFHRFQEQILGHITGSQGEGKIRTYIHEVFPLEKIQDAHRTMEADANAYVVSVRASGAVSGADAPWSAGSSLSRFPEDVHPGPHPTVQGPA